MVEDHEPAGPVRQWREVAIYEGKGGYRRGPKKVAR
jgi:hypothetical protein